MVLLLAYKLIMGTQMAKKTWTDEERKAFGLKMKMAREAKSQNQNEKTNKQDPIKVDQPEIERKDTISMDDYLDLKREIEELKRSSWQPQPQGVGLKNGRLVGTVEKYNLTKDYYPDETLRLAKESRLARFAFDENYELRFDVSTTEYQTIDGIRTKEPKFTLELIGKVFDDDTGELTSGRYIICRLIMHEDPEAALVIAREQHLDVDEDNEESFLNEMRYIRQRDWLVKCFYPEVSKKDNRKKEMVIGGKIVEYFEVDALEEEHVRLPFNKLDLTKKL